MLESHYYHHSDNGGLFTFLGLIGIITVGCIAYGTGKKKGRAEAEEKSQALQIEELKRQIEEMKNVRTQ